MFIRGYGGLVTTVLYRNSHIFSSTLGVYSWKYVNTADHNWKIGNLRTDLET